MNELDKLTEYLKENHYRYTRIDEPPVRVNKYLSMDRHQVIVYDNNSNRLWDAICQQGSYGSCEGLLEVSGIITTEKEGVEGWLTADEVIRRL